MSVVKKLQSGGQLDYSTIEKDVSDFIHSPKFKSKIQPDAEQLAPKILEAFKSGAIKIDPITNSYTIDPTTYKGDVIELQGTKDIKDKKNIFGQITEKTGKAGINEAIISYVYNKYPNLVKSSTNTPNTPKATSSGITRSIKPLESYIIENEFSGDNTSFQKYLESLGSEEAAQKYITDLGKKHLLSYKEQQDKNLLKPENERDIYTDIPDFNDILNSANSGYNGFYKNALKLNWDLNSIINPEYWEQKRANNLINKVNSAVDLSNQINEGLSNAKQKNQEYLNSLGISPQQITQPIIRQKVNLPDYSWLKNIDKEVVEDKSSYLNEVSNHIIAGFQPSEVDVKKLAFIAENQEDLSDDDKAKLQILLDNIRKSNAFKEGGTIKLQTGGKITSDELRKKLEGINVKIAKGTTLKNITRDPLSKESILSGISTAGDIGSFIPGYGAIGGLVTTFVDAIKGGTDIKGWEEEDTKKLATNLGFTALALVGFGGLKSLLKASKLADKAVDVTKIAGLSEDFIKFTNTIKNPTPKVLTSIVENLDKTKGGKVIVGKIIGEVTPETTKALKLSLAKDLGKVIQNTEPKMIEKVNSMAMKVFDNPFTQSKYISKISPFVRSTVGLGVVGDAAISVKDAVTSGNIGNLTIEDTGNILRSGMLAKGYFNDKTIKKLLKKETDIIPKKSVISIKDSEGKQLEKGLLEGDLPKIRDKYIFKKPDSKQIIEKYNSSKGKNIPNTATIKVEKEIPEQLVQKKEYSEKLAKMLEKRGVAIKPPKIKKVTMNKKGGILKYQNGKPIIWSGGVQPIINFPNLWNTLKTWNTLPKGTPTVSVGGPKIKPGTINVPVESKWKMPIQAFPVGKSTNEENNKDVTSLKPLETIYKPRIVETLNTIEPKTISKLPTTIEKPTLKQASVSGDILTPKTSFLDKVKGLSSKIDYTDLSNLAMYINTVATNSKIAQSQKKAAMAGIVKLPTISNEYIRTSAKSSHFYDLQANKIRGVGKRLSESTSDIDKGFGARLASEQQALDISGKGEQIDQQNISREVDQQQASNRQTELQNLGIIGQNLQSVSGAEKALSLIDANKMLTSASALNNLITATNRNKEIKDSKNRAIDFYEMSKDPEIKNISEEWQALNSEEAIAKQAFLDKIKDGTNTVSEGVWENSPEAIKYSGLKKSLLARSKPIEEKINAARYAMQYGLPIKRAKGGTLAEKKYLIDLKHQQKRELEDQKQYYKTILQNNEILMKSLIKVFK